MLDFNSNKEDLYIYDRQIDFFFAFNEDKDSCDRFTKCSEVKITPEDFPHVCFLVEAEESVLQFDYYLSRFLCRFVTQ